MNQMTEVQVKKRLEAHGIGRHSRAEVIQIGLDDLDAMSAYLGDKLYLTGQLFSILCVVLIRQTRGQEEKVDRYEC